MGETHLAMLSVQGPVFPGGTGWIVPRSSTVSAVEDSWSWWAWLRAGRTRMRDPVTPKAAVRGERRAPGGQQPPPHPLRGANPGPAPYPGHGLSGPPPGNCDRRHSLRGRPGVLTNGMRTRGRQGGAACLLVAVLGIGGCAPPPRTDDPGRKVEQEKVREQVREHRQQVEQRERLGR